MYLVNCSIMILKNKQPKTLARADICLLKAALPHNQFKVTTRDKLKMVFNVFFVLFRGGFLGMSRSIKKHNNNSTTGLHTQCHAHSHTLWIYAQHDPSIQRRMLPHQHSWGCVIFGPQLISVHRQDMQRQAKMDTCMTGGKNKPHLMSNSYSRQVQTESPLHQDNLLETKHKQTAEKRAKTLGIFR